MRLLPSFGNGVVLPLFGTNFAWSNNKPSLPPPFLYRNRYHRMHKSQLHSLKNGIHISRLILILQVQIVQGSTILFECFFQRGKKETGTYEKTPATFLYIIGSLRCLKELLKPGTFHTTLIERYNATI